MSTAKKNAIQTVFWRAVSLTVAEQFWVLWRLWLNLYSAQLGSYSCVGYDGFCPAPRDYGAGEHHVCLVSNSQFQPLAQRRHLW